jgi:hypothetical protein
LVEVVNLWILEERNVLNIEKTIAGAQKYCKYHTPLKNLVIRVGSNDLDKKNNKHVYFRNEKSTFWFSHDLLYRRSCLFFRYLNDIGSFLPWHRIFRRSSSERFLRHKYAGSDSVKCVISSLPALLLLGPGTGVGVGVDIIHVVTWSSIEPMVATFSVTDFSQSCCGLPSLYFLVVSGNGSHRWRYRSSGSCASFISSLAGLRR